MSKWVLTFEYTDICLISEWRNLHYFVEASIPFLDGNKLIESVSANLVTSQNCEAVKVRSFDRISLASEIVGHYFNVVDNYFMFFFAKNFIQRLFEVVQCERLPIFPFQVYLEIGTESVNSSVCSAGKEKMSKSCICRH